MQEDYNVTTIQDKWLPVWDDLKPFDSSRKRRHQATLSMFWTCSHTPLVTCIWAMQRPYALGDVIARYWGQKGYNVMHPIGWDAFGLPAENAAIKRGLDPRAWTYENIAQQKASMRRYACSFDWDRVLQTCDPSYYQWNQWLFLELYSRGLAYRKNSNVNWCPSCQTVLANEQVVQGLCERCDSVVTKKSLTQWYFKVTDYADRLLDDLSQLEGKVAFQGALDCSETGLEDLRVQTSILQSRAWIKRFQCSPLDLTLLYGATFMVLAADSELAQELASAAAPEIREQFNNYLEEVKKANDIERLATDRKKTGVFLGHYALNPINDERIPVWVSDYVLADYGTGAIMAVPAHDDRDIEFAKTFDLPVFMVVDTGEEDPAVSGIATSGDGVIVKLWRTERSK